MTRAPAEPPWSEEWIAGSVRCSASPGLSRRWECCSACSASHSRCTRHNAFRGKTCDELIHAFTSFWVTLLVAVYARRSIFDGISGHVWWKLGLIAAAGVSVGVAWEIGEWLFDHTLGGPTVKSKYDTSIDLVVDAIGAVTGAATGLWLTRARRFGRPSPLPGPRPGRMQPSAR